MASSKTLLLFGLAFAILIISSEVIAETQEQVQTDGYEHGGKGGYGKGGGGYGGGYGRGGGGYGGGYGKGGGYGRGGGGYGKGGGKGHGGHHGGYPGHGAEEGN